MSREGRNAPRLCCTGAVTRVATAARAEREKAAADILDCARCENGQQAESRSRVEKRETWLFLVFACAVFLRLSAYIRDWPAAAISVFWRLHIFRRSNIFLGVFAIDLASDPIPTFAKWRYRGDVCRAGRFVDFASRGGGASPAQRSQRDGDAREVSVFVRRRGRVSDARR